MALAEPIQLEDLVAHERMVQEKTNSYKTQDEQNDYEGFVNFSRELQRTAMRKGDLEGYDELCKGIIRPTTEQMNTDSREIVEQEVECMEKGEIEKFFGFYSRTGIPLPSEALANVKDRAQDTLVNLKVTDNWSWFKVATNAFGMSLDYRDHIFPKQLSYILGTSEPGEGRQQRPQKYWESVWATGHQISDNVLLGYQEGMGIEVSQFLNAANPVLVREVPEAPAEAVIEAQPGDSGIQELEPVPVREETIEGEGVPPPAAPPSSLVSGNKGE